MRHRLLKLRRAEGQAVVELALVVPLLLVLIFGIIDFGLAINQYNDTTNLANIAARQLSVASNSSTWSAPVCPGGTASTSLINYVQCMGKQDNGALASAEVCPFDSTAGSGTGSYTTGDTIRVEVYTNFNWLKLFYGDGVVSGATTTVSSTAYMRQEATSSGSSSAESWITSGVSAQSSPSCPTS